MDCGISRASISRIKFLGWSPIQESTLPRLPTRNTLTDVCYLIPSAFTAQSDCCHTSCSPYVYYSCYVDTWTYAVGLDLRDARDAHVVFEAVRLKILPLVTRRLTAIEREQLTSGNVFVWEEAEHKQGKTAQFRVLVQCDNLGNFCRWS